MRSPLFFTLLLWMVPGTVWFLSQTTLPATQRARIESPKGHSTAGKSMHILIGTYTRTGSRGIYRSQIDLDTGVLSPPELAVEAVDPSFLALHPNGLFLYSTNEVRDLHGSKSGGVSSFALDAGKAELTFLNQTSSQGGVPCYITIDPSGKNLLVANYIGGTVAVLPLDPEGRLKQASFVVDHKGIDPASTSHPHSVVVDPTNRFALAPDVGLDRIFLYQFDATAGTLKPHNPRWLRTAGGSGPRHFAFHPKGRFAYVINESDSHLSALAYDAGKGTLEILQTVSTLPPDFKEKSWPADVQVSPSGKFLYGSNRGHDSIVVFRIDQHNGRLTPLQHQSCGGEHPRHFAIDPTGHFMLVANPESNNVVVLRIDVETGTLSETGHGLSLSSAAHIRFVPAP